jgi:hypothetical protein
MAQVSNQELVEKAIIATDAIASSGKLNPAQADAFIDYVVEETELSKLARVVKFRNEQMDIDKIGVGRRVTVPKDEAADPGNRKGISTSKVSLTPVTLMTPFEITDEFRETNLEGDKIEDTIIKLMSRQLGNDIEEFYINGNTLGPARLEGDLKDGGSTTLYIKDSLWAKKNGWSELAEGANVVDAAGQNIGTGLFGAAIRALPTKFRRNTKDLVWLMSPDLWQLYQEKLSTRATTLGDSATSGGVDIKPQGVAPVAVPLWPLEPTIVEHIAPVSGVVVTAITLNQTPTAAFVVDTDYSVDATAGTITRVGAGITDGATVKVTYQSAPQMILTHKSNLIVAIGRDVRIEKDREIFRGVNQYAITTKVDINFEELDAIVKVKNIGMGV